MPSLSFDCYWEREIHILKLFGFEVWESNLLSIFINNVMFKETCDSLGLRESGQPWHKCMTTTRLASFVLFSEALRDGFVKH